MKESNHGLSVLRRPLLFPDRVWRDVEKNEISRPALAGALLRSVVDGAAVTKALYGALEERGLGGLYRVVLRTAPGELAGTVNEVLEAVDCGRGVLFHCQKGKDRTGLVAAALQVLWGEDEERIVEEYALSEAALLRDEGLYEAARPARPARPAAGKASGKAELDWGKFEGSPPGAMRETLEYMKESSSDGTTQGFLFDCGVSEELAARFRQTRDRSLCSNPAGPRASKPP